MQEEPIDWRYLPYCQAYVFGLCFCGNIPTIHMAQNMVLRLVYTSIESDPEDLPLIQCRFYPKVFSKAGDVHDQRFGRFPKSLHPRPTKKISRTTKKQTTKRDRHKKVAHRKSILKPMPMTFQGSSAQFFQLTLRKAPFAYQPLDIMFAQGWHYHSPQPSTIY